MTMRVYRHYEDWTPVKGDFRQPAKTCPRCGNHVQYALCYEGEQWLLWGRKKAQVFAYKCPICPNYEIVEMEVAKAIIESGK